MRRAPVAKGLGAELRPVVDPQDGRQAALAAQVLQDADHPASGEGGVDLDGQDFPGAFVDDRENAKRAAGPHRVLHEVERPDLVRAASIGWKSAQDF